MLGYVSLGSVRIRQDRLGQDRIEQDWFGKVRLGWGQVRLGQITLGLVRLGQVQIGDVRLGYVRLGFQIYIFKDTLTTDIFSDEPQCQELRKAATMNAAFKLVKSKIWILCFISRPCTKYSPDNWVLHWVPSAQTNLNFKFRSKRPQPAPMQYRGI